MIGAGHRSIKMKLFLTLAATIGIANGITVTFQPGEIKTFTDFSPRYIDPSLIGDMKQGNLFLSNHEIG